MEISCDMCDSALKEQGGLLFGPPENLPDREMPVADKFHLCKACFADFKHVINRDYTIIDPIELN